MTEKTKKLIEEKALALLLSQNIRGEFALAFLDLRKAVTGGAAAIDSFSSYEKRTGVSLPADADGITVRASGMNIILYNDKVRNDGRRNWTIAHELGHVLLSHTEVSKRNEHEADAFAAELLIPEAVLRFLDAREGTPISPEEMTNYFSASLSACRRRRLNIPSNLAYRPTEREKELLKRLFEPKV